MKCLILKKELDLNFKLHVDINFMCLRLVGNALIVMLGFLHLVAVLMWMYTEMWAMWIFCG